ncbi:hypothetical protein Aazo_4691 ['Nostoc azollae' 0708]|jgi:hypothetical protein|uniref:Uncharacterized protein n=1 Tax=Nostoc azollae (strain 0708) TaxID=551115 RepID=D7DXS5_NOSA0|nr:hypothetical protein Aazo_4691 ['Nostoc azollae' 0708]
MAEYLVIKTIQNQEQNLMDDSDIYQLDARQTSCYAKFSSQF